MSTDTRIAALLGDVADGRPVAPDDRAAARRAVTQPPRWFVSVHVADAGNVDTEELFFERTPTDSLDLDDEATAFLQGVVPLDILLDAPARARAAARWLDSTDPDHPRQWEAFLRRVARPLAAALELGPLD